MKTDKKSVAQFLISWIWAAVILLWFLIPLTGSKPSLFSAYPELKAFGHLALATFVVIAGFICFASFLWLAVRFFIQNKLTLSPEFQKLLSIIAQILSSAVIILIPTALAFVFADRNDYFKTWSWWTWFFGTLAIICNAISIRQLIIALNEKKDSYRDYMAYKQQLAMGHHYKNKFFSYLTKSGIQKRLTLAFTSLILLTVVILASVLLTDFGKTLLRAIMDSGSALADRTASIIKTNISDRIAMEDYLSIEAKKNENAAFPFNSVSYYRRDPKSTEYVIRVSTNPALENQVLDADSAALINEEASMLDSSDSIEFRAPVNLSGVNLGFVSVIYERQTIYGPFYRTMVKTIVISLLFLYISIFITYLFGRTISQPILYLGMSVNLIATRLQSMVRGQSKVSADKLHYEDRVDTRDEIKSLSMEIGNMTTVIRGVVPYISASTLQHSERSTPMTEQKNLAFLFTDIRGFTSICEGLSPEDVVNMLNHYLDLQTEAVIENGGDIDKFVGDELMAVFDGPDKELRACKAGMAIRSAMAKAQEEARNKAGSIISIGLGINSGPVVFGSVGARDRMDFTSIGDTVNLAARLEGANKTYGTKSLISETVYNRVKDHFLCREIDMIAVKGKNIPVRIFEVLQEIKKSAAKLEEIKASFESGLAAYRKQNWAEAKRHFSLGEKKFNDEASAVFLKRIAVFESSPPPTDWDGVFRMTVK